MLLLKWVNLTKLKHGLATRDIMRSLANQLPIGLQWQHQILKDHVGGLAPIKARLAPELDFSSRTKCHDLGHSLQVQDGLRIFNVDGVLVGPEKKIKYLIKYFHSKNWILFIKREIKKREIKHSKISFARTNFCLRFCILHLIGSFAEETQIFKLTRTFSHQHHWFLYFFYWKKSVNFAMQSEFLWASYFTFFRENRKYIHICEIGTVFGKAKHRVLQAWGREFWAISRVENGLHYLYD